MMNENNDVFTMEDLSLIHIFADKRQQFQDKGFTLLFRHFIGKLVFHDFAELTGATVLYLDEYGV